LRSEREHLRSSQYNEHNIYFYERPQYDFQTDVQFASSCHIISKDKRQLVVESLK